VRFAAHRADVAQLVEHSLGKGEVISSILIIGSRSSGAVRASAKAGARSRNPERSGRRDLAVSRLSGSNSVVESQPSKLLVAGSIPVSRSRV
jgi:hypothetical protein